MLVADVLLIQKLEPFLTYSQDGRPTVCMCACLMQIKQRKVEYSKSQSFFVFVFVFPS